MASKNKIIWTEGMFLRPHHFQQQELYIENYINSWGISQNPFYWGFTQLEIDQTLLTQGKFAISQAAGIMPDGTPFFFENMKQAPLPLAIMDNKNSLNIVLALPSQYEGKKSTIFEEQKHSLARYLAFEQDIDDVNTTSMGSAPLQFANPRFQLMLEDDLTSDWITMRVAIVIEKMNDNSIRLDTNYIPPILRCNADQTMQGFINELFGTLQQRSKDLNARIGQDEIGMSNINDLIMLQLINRYIGQLSHVHTIPQLHPERVFSEWLKFSCELVTFSENRIPNEQLPNYDHNNLTLCFSQLMAQLRERLSFVLKEHAIAIELQERAHGLYVSVIHDKRMFSEFNFILAVRADLPKDVIMTHYPTQVKIGPISRIRDLVQLQLPGITLSALPIKPQYLPLHTGYIYFELVSEGDLWQQIEKSGNFALHIAGDFPGLKMELWAIQD